LSEYDILHLDGWAGAAAIKAAKIVRANGGTVVLDAGSVKPQMQELLPLVNVLIASQLFQNSQFGSTAATDEQLLSLGIPNVITTDGSHGATWITDDDRLHEPALRIKVIDTNGAGDVFSGAILHALASGWNRQATLKFANQVAGYVCQHRGNSSLPEISTELNGSEFH